MNNKFDELTKSMAQSVTRRAALKKFSLGLAGMALGCFGLANRANAATVHGYCQVSYLTPGEPGLSGTCISVGTSYPGYCLLGRSSDCKASARINLNNVTQSPCFPTGYSWATNKKCSFSA